MRYVLMEEASSKKRARKYKCPYCDNRYIRSDLVSHVQRMHEDMIPEGYTALRVVFNYINHKECGKCMICEQPTAWNEKKGRYESLCGREECKEAYKKMVRERNQKRYGVDDPTKDPRYAEEIQKKALANRGISGKYKFQDGGIVEYMGSYEKKLLEFMDKIMYINSTDILAPAPIVYYQYQGKEHMYIPDFLYIPYNLIIEVKDGKENEAKNINQDSRDRTVAKEQAIREQNKFNYIRLTNNNFSQLMEVFALLKYTLEEYPEQHVVRVNESAVLEDTMNKFTLLEQASKLDPNYNKKGKLSLSSFKKIKATNSNLDNYKDKFPKSVYKYMKSYCNESDPDYSTLSYFWIDDKNDNAYVGNCSVSKYTDGDSVIHSIEINKQYRGYGLSKQILDICTKELDGFMLAVEKKNEIAYKTYLSYGFIVYLENDRYYYMVLKSKKELVQKYIKNESAIVEAVNSSINSNHIQHGNLKLSEFKKITITEDIIKKYKPIAKYLSHFRTGKDYSGYIWLDNGNVVAACMVHISENEIQAVEISKDYQGYGLSYQILDICVKQLNGFKLTVNKKNEVAISVYKKYGFVIYKTTDTMYFMCLKSKINSVSESGANAIAAALAPWPVPYEANKNNYYMVQHLQNNVYNYSITKDPTQSEVIGIDPEKGYVVQKMKKSDIPGSYITFKMKDWEKADEVYKEAVEKLKLGQCVDDTEYFYRRYTGRNILTDDQIVYDESFTLIPNFDQEISDYCTALENYLTKTDTIDLLEEQVAELKLFGGNHS